LYSSNIIPVIKSKITRCAGHVVRVQESIGAYGVLVGKPEGGRPLGRPKRIWKQNIEIEVKEVG